LSSPPVGSIGSTLPVKQERQAVVGSFRGEDQIHKELQGEKRFGRMEIKAAARQ
jgi:hypothetical protein